MKSFFLFSLSILQIFNCFTQNASTTPYANQQFPNTLLWKITGKNLKHPSYLFGTMHILCADDAVLSDSLKSVIKNCDEIFFEIDMTDLMGMVSSMKYMRMNDDKKLSDILSETDYVKVKGYFEKHPSLLPFSMLEHFKPMLISSMIEENNLPCSTTNGMELLIMGEAKKQNKKINGLETALFQASLFDSIPYKVQAQDLVKYIDSGDQSQKLTDTLYLAYKAGDLNQIEALTIREDPATASYMDLLLYGRNRKWIKNMQKLLPEKSLLFAVGAGHLPGEQGLIRLLRRSGYIVTPIMNL